MNRTKDNSGNCLVSEFLAKDAMRIMGKEQASERQGFVLSPISRAARYLTPWEAAELESGKFFPKREGGLTDPYIKSDAVNSRPPEDGRIASAGKDFATILDEVGRHRWVKQAARLGGEISFEWSYTMKRRTRRWNYFITRADWDPEKPLTRAQFEETPFHTVELGCQPFWVCSEELIPINPSYHTCKLPFRWGYHVVLAVCELADSGSAYYQVIDLDFSI